MTTSKRAEIWWDTAVKAYRLKADFNQGLIDWLKSQIPYSDRSYNEIPSKIHPGKTDKIWTFTEGYLDGVKKFCELAYGKQNVVCLLRSQVEASQSSSTVNRVDGLESACVEFMKLLPYEAAQRAYRQAALVLHPDRGGNMEKMSKINSIWTRLEKELYNQ